MNADGPQSLAKGGNCLVDPGKSVFDAGGRVFDLEIPNFQGKQGEGRGTPSYFSDRLHRSQTLRSTVSRVGILGIGGNSLSNSRK